MGTEEREGRSVVREASMAGIRGYGKKGRAPSVDTMPHTVRR